MNECMLGELGPPVGGGHGQDPGKVVSGFSVLPRDLDVGLRLDGGAVP